MLPVVELLRAEILNVQPCYLHVSKEQVFPSSRLTGLDAIGGLKDTRSADRTLNILRLCFVCNNTESK